MSVVALVAALVIILGTPLGAAPGADWFPRGLAPIDTGGLVASAASCGTCHPRAHAEWAASRHGLSWTNAIFQREYQDKPLAWCVHCHAPLKEQLAEAQARGGPLANEGITCVACHVRDGHLWARRRAAHSPHDTQVRADFGGPAFCGGCHQFNFPVVVPATAEQPAHVDRYTALPMQDTERQHARGPHAQEECRRCHVEAAGSTHGYPGAHDAAFVARALTVTSCRAGDSLEIALSNTGAGHNVPTGDLHRHLVLRAWRPSAPERLGEALFGRRFEAAEDGGKRTVEDTTIPAGATVRRRFRLAELGGSPREPVRVELRLVYTIDEFPFRGRELAEPTWITMREDELRPGALPPCSISAPTGARRPARSSGP